MNKAEIRMNEATDKMVDYMYREEDRHFREWLDEEDKKDPKIFIAKLKEHIFYSVVVMKYRGDAEKINEWINIYWEENGEPDDEDDYEEGEKEFIDAVKNDDFEMMKSLFEKKKNGGFNKDDDQHFKDCGCNMRVDCDCADDDDDDNFTCDVCKCVKDREYYISVIGDESGNTICEECVDQYMKDNGFENQTDF